MSSPLVDMSYVSISPTTITTLFTYRARATSSQGGEADLCLALLDGGREPAIEDFNFGLLAKDCIKKLSLSEIGHLYL